MPLLGDPQHDEMVETLKKIAGSIDTPSAILLISAHWETNLATVTSGISPELIYDYSGFPKEAYEIRYPALGEPQLATEVVDALKLNGIETSKDDYRGFDHGLFVPLKIMFPDADIPCVQLSLVGTLASELHIRIGKALQELQWDNLLVIGSGFSFHNMRAFFTQNSKEASAHNIAFDNWLRETVGDRALPESIREERLTHWVSAPSARYCHPREEHLLPLHVCYGLAAKSSDETFRAKILKKHSSMFHWSL